MAAPAAAMPILSALAAVEAPPKSPKELFNELMIKNDGLLFDDKALSIAVRLEVNKFQGRVTLVFNNKTQTTIDQFRCFLQPVPFLRVQASPLPAAIAPQASQTQVVTFDCVDPFLEAPNINLSFAGANGNVTQTLKLPIAITKFAEPVQCNAQQFFAVWARFVGPPLEYSGVFKSAKTINLVDAGQVLGVGLRLQVLQGVDTVATNVVAAGKAVFPNAGEVILLVRLEANMAQQAYRLVGGGGGGADVADCADVQQLCDGCGQEFDHWPIGSRAVSALSKLTNETPLTNSLFQ